MSKLQIKTGVIIRINTYETGCEINVLSRPDKDLKDETQVFTDPEKAKQYLYDNLFVKPS